MIVSANAWQCVCGEEWLGDWLEKAGDSDVGDGRTFRISRIYTIQYLYVFFSRCSRMSGDGGSSLRCGSTDGDG